VRRDLVEISMLEGSSIRSHKDLEVWKGAVSLAERLYRDTAHFPRMENYGMTAQIRRAAVSVAANIAEGYGRGQTTQFIQFLRISQGSIQELDTHVILAERFVYFKPQISIELQDACQQSSKMLRSLIRSLEAKAKGDSPMR
jgi:four helix bundle protein